MSRAVGELAAAVDGAAAVDAELCVAAGGRRRGGRRHHLGGDAVRAELSADRGEPARQRAGATRGEILDLVVKLSAYAMALLAIIGLVGGWILAGRMLRPLQEITAAARLAASGSLDHRIGLGGIRDEFTDLSDTFDEMLERLQRSFEQYRRFAANASHELRTPHAVMKTMLEVAMADPDHQDVRELVDGCTRRTSAGSTSSRRCSRWRRSTIARSSLVPSISRRSPGGREGAARRRALDCELANGCRGQQSFAAPAGFQPAAERDPPWSGAVTVTTTPGGGLTVTNTGEVLDPAKVRTFTEPFTRVPGLLIAAGSAGRTWARPGAGRRDRRCPPRHARSHRQPHRRSHRDSDGPGSA